MKEAFLPILLSEIKPGMRVMISGYSQSEVPLKMLEMGLLPGNEILVKRIAPMRDPMHIEVAGYDLALRREEAALIQVREFKYSEVEA